MTATTNNEHGYLVLRFLGALILGPAIGAVVSYLAALPISFLLGVWEVVPEHWIFLLAPSMGLMFGLPYYLSAGTLAFIITIGMGRTGIGDFARAAFLANLASPLLSLPIYQDGDYALMLLYFGAFAAPVWGAGFGLIFGWLGGRER